MLQILAVWQVAPVQGWVGPTVAISLAIVALSFVAVAVALVVVLSRLIEPLHQLSRVIQNLQEDLSWSVKGMRQLTDQSQELLALVRQEAGAFAHAGRRLRRQVVKGADRIQTKLEDLETLYDIVHDEVEDTALDVAAVLRSVRQGNGVLGRIRRLLVARRR
jgi:nitrate/nitrite-specific signal transduction histidine kinase